MVQNFSKHSLSVAKYVKVNVSSHRFTKILDFRTRRGKVKETATCNFNLKNQFCSDERVRKGDCSEQPSDTKKKSDTVKETRSKRPNRQVTLTESRQSSNNVP